MICDYNLDISRIPSISRVSSIAIHGNRFDLTVFCKPTSNKVVKFFKFDVCEATTFKLVNYFLIILAFLNTENPGPTFKFKDVGVYDLGDGLTLADYIKVGSNVKIQAKVRSYNSDTGLFELDPVSVEAR